MNWSAGSGVITVCAIRGRVGRWWSCWQVLLRARAACSVLLTPLRSRRLPTNIFRIECCVWSYRTNKRNDAVEVGELEFFERFYCFWMQLWFFWSDLSLSLHFWKREFWIFWMTKLKKCSRQKFAKNNEISIVFDTFCYDFHFFIDKISKNVVLLTKSWFSCFKILCSSCEICVTKTKRFVIV